MKWKSTRNAIEGARTELPKLVEKYFKAGRKASDGKRSPHELHQFRIKTKQFRYTLELFRPLYGAPLEQELDAVRGLQSVLGKLHDFHVIASLLAGDRAVQAKLQRLTRKKLKDFHQQWASFDSNGQLKRWKQFLARNPAKSAHAKQRSRNRVKALSR